MPLVATAPRDDPNNSHAEVENRTCYMLISCHATYLQMALCLKTSLTSMRLMPAHFVSLCFCHTLKQVTHLWLPSAGSSSIFWYVVFRPARWQINLSP